MTLEQRREFARSIAAAAQAAQKKWGVPASILIAQAGHESRWGKSSLARKHNNFFGVPKHRPKVYVEYSQTLITAGKFQSFRSVSACFLAHARLIATSEVYFPAMKKAHDPLQFGIELQECGYSSDSYYGSRIGQIVIDCDLAQYDIAKEAVR